MKKLSRKDTLTFGMHKGETIGGVMDDNPSYICWAIDNISSFKLSDKDIKAARELSIEMTNNNSSEYYGEIDVYDFCD